MSQLSINTLSKERYAQEADDFILHNFENYFFYKHFKVGEDIKNYSEIKHNMAIKRMMCNPTCEISNYIKCQLPKPEVQKQYVNRPQSNTFYILTESLIILSSENGDSLIYQ